MDIQQSEYYKTEYPDFRQVLKAYCFCMYKLIDMYYEEQQRKFNSPYILQYGVQLIHNVFCNCILHTKHTKGSTHTTEQAITYYIEYLNQFQTHYLKLNPADAYQFVLKNTLFQIPHSTRKKTLEQSNHWFTTLDEILEIWCFWVNHLFQSYHTIWMNYSNDELYREYRTLFNEITNLCQKILNVDDLTRIIQWNHTLSLLDIPFKDKLKLAHKNLDTPFDCSQFLHSWLMDKDDSIKNKEDL